ncbi:uncharacterized protein SPPG_02542 [Spizellomyces punctatus DAOM BR117]|uniref:BTB domain-containing protein n=1 Tax=Spizellomyces punctatus (strain DAOM BR117) TaxID=645134 RepID=A0A0L0HLU3_SPIPD|nr:uncharacterized protein SPPG_02542 [Spizellomyces punctatus DAOM BR117]KND02038.1 hypothetical protein SPPG_02542 [Spizellomyces punctatus DAOM BR117]|eukprot:XP_016610077.1 hypothetical protein SPPG_02542 [Spizellomyces punctatus DAOM BR117]
MSLSNSAALMPVLPRKTTGAPAHACLVNASCTLVDNKVYVFGGFHMYTDEVYNDILVFNVNDSHWKRLEHVKGNWPVPRNSHTTTYWKDGKLVIFGGQDVNDEFLNDVYILHLRTLTWEKPEVSGDIPSGRAKHSAVIHNDKLYIAGGCQGKENDVSRDLHVLDLNTFTWEPHVPFVRRYSHFSCIYRNRLYIYGGMYASLDCATDIAFIDLDDMNVSQVVVKCEDSPPKLGQHFAQLCGNNLVVVVTQCLKYDENAIATTTGIWTLGLDSLRWRRHENSDMDQRHASWHYYVMNPDDRRFILFGTNDRDPDESNLTLVLTLDLETYGIVYVPPGAAGRDYSILFEKPEFADFTIMSSEKDMPPILVHRLILSTRWPHFRNICTSGMSEAASATLTLEDPYHSVRAFLRYLYTDSLEGMSVETVANLLVMGNRYCLDRLQKLCCADLHARMDVESVATVYARACMVQDEGLCQRALFKIMDDFGRVTKTAGFRELTHEQLIALWDAIPREAFITA